jgi:uncharacterized MAPEG superfamily protein
MLNDLERQAVDSMVSGVRTSMEKILGVVDREIMIEFAAALVNSVLTEGEATSEVRGGAVVFFSHRLMQHGGQILECNRCRKSFSD